MHSMPSTHIVVILFSLFTSSPTKAMIAAKAIYIQVMIDIRVNLMQ